jgi:hypothetical protein
VCASAIAVGTRSDGFYLEILNLTASLRLSAWRQEKRGALSARLSFSAPPPKIIATH